jgi:RNA polymerase sigma factor (TIGR02999 family)
MDLPPGNISDLLRECGHGRSNALAQLIQIAYDELRSLAHRHLQRERPGHTLNTTALVHEVYLHLAVQRGLNWESRAHFFGAAAQMMRRVLIDYARSRDTVKRGAALVRVGLEDCGQTVEGPDVDVLALDEALRKLAELDERQAAVVELRYFGGLSIAETAEVLGYSPATVKNEWAIARAWLWRELSGADGDAP